MKLNPKSIKPENNTLCFVITDHVKEESFFNMNRSKILQGIVGIALFSDDKWYSVPTGDEITINFQWVSFDNQPERLSEKTSKEDAIV